MCLYSGTLGEQVVKDMEVAGGNGPRLEQLVSMAQGTLQFGVTVMLHRGRPSVKKSDDGKILCNVCISGSQPQPPMTGTATAVEFCALVS